MANPRNSRITRTPGPKAPRAARKRKPLSEETAAELLAAPPPVEAPPEIVVEPPRAAIPWTPPKPEARESSPWLGLDGRTLVRAAVKRIGRALVRRIPVLGLIFRA